MSRKCYCSSNIGHCSSFLSLISFSFLFFFCFAEKFTKVYQTCGKSQILVIAGSQSILQNFQRNFNAHIFWDVLRKSDGSIAPKRGWLPEKCPLSKPPPRRVLILESYRNSLGISLQSSRRRRSPTRSPFCAWSGASLETSFRTSSTAATGRLRFSSCAKASQWPGVALIQSN